MKIIHNILLMTNPQTGKSDYSFLIMMAMMVVVFYFFMILPQQKRAKKQNEYRAGLQVGSKIITTGGVHGKICAVNDTTFIIETETGKLKIEKAAVSVEMTQALEKKPS